jgi:hypothetical protein
LSKYMASRGIVFTPYDLRALVCEEQPRDVTTG